MSTEKLGGTQRIFSGAIWNGLSQVIIQGSTILTTILVARELGPGPYGLVGMAAIFTALLAFFIEFGLLSSYILTDKPTKVDEGSIFTTSLILSATLYGLSFYLAPYVSAFYGENITEIIRVLFLQFLFVPFGIIPEASERKSMEFKKISISLSAATIISSALAITLAYLGAGAWSLVAQPIALISIKNTSLALQTKKYPQLYFTIKTAKRHLKTGWQFT